MSSPRRSDVDDGTATLVNTIYKSLLDRFNPCAKQIISTGKTYLKAMHSAAAAFDTYIEAISKLAKCSQEGVWGGSTDIGGTLAQLVTIQKEVQDLQSNVLKAFFVDLIVPLETNLEKDTKAVNVEQKKFVQEHKVQNEALAKATSAVKKHRKKSRTGSRLSYAEKETKSIQVLEEKKSSVLKFHNKSLKQAIRQERRRYGFVLERQCSLINHYKAYHQKTAELYDEYLPQWENVSKTREILPDHVDAMLPADHHQDLMEQQRYTLRSDSIENGGGGEMEHRYNSVNNNNDNKHDLLDGINGDGSSVRRSRSVDNLKNAVNEDGVSMSNVSVSSTLRKRQQQQIAPDGMSRARSEVNLNGSQSKFTGGLMARPRPKSMVVANEERIVRAAYAYLSSGDNQLSFHEGDMILLIGERNKGWQFGENLRNNKTGWFPVAYTEDFTEDDDDSLGLDSCKRNVDRCEPPVKSSNQTGSDSSPQGTYVLPIIRRSRTTSFFSSSSSNSTTSSSDVQHNNLSNRPLTTFDSSRISTKDNKDQARNSVSDGIGHQRREKKFTNDANTHFTNYAFPKHTSTTTVPESFQQTESSIRYTKATGATTTSNRTDRVQGMRVFRDLPRDYDVVIRRKSVAAPIITPSSPITTDFSVKEQKNSTDVYDGGAGTITLSRLN